MIEMKLTLSNQVFKDKTMRSASSKLNSTSLNQHYVEVNPLTLMLLLMTMQRRSPNGHHRALSGHHGLDRGHQKQHHCPAIRRG